MRRVFAGAVGGVGALCLLQAALAQPEVLFAGTIEYGGFAEAAANPPQSSLNTATVSGGAVSAGGGTSSGPVSAELVFFEAFQTFSGSRTAGITVRAEGWAAHNGEPGEFGSASVFAHNAWWDPLVIEIFETVEYSITPPTGAPVDLVPVSGNIFNGRLTPGQYIIEPSFAVGVNEPGDFAFNAFEWSLDMTALCRADYDGSGVVNSGDFFAFIGAFIAGDADINGDFVTDSADFFDFIGSFLGGC